MYQILIDGRDLYYPGDEEYMVTDSVVNLQLNDSGSVEFNLPVTNPEYANIKNRISMIQILKNGNEIFYGEVREAEKDFYGTKQVYAVGELAFLFDSIQPQAKYRDKTARQLLEAWLNVHNSQVEEKKRFYVGMVTVHDSNDSLYRFTNQETTLDCIREKICEKLNGYLRIRKVDGRRYLDLVTLQDYGKICEQPIEFGENLLDYAENVSASDLYTCVIPKGARLEESKIEGLESYVDITSVNSGKDYLYSQEAVNLYGWNRCVVSWDDVTESANLKKKGEQWLKDNQYETMVLELSAADMSLLDIDMESFELGDSVPVYSKPHGMDRTFPVQKLELHLQNPAEDKLQLGNSMKLSYTEQNKGHYQYIEQELENNRQTTSWLQSAIDNATAMMTGSKGGYKVTEFDEKGRWLRDLYMNAPSKEQATQLMQINMNGIGFSRDGFDGPYKNAWTIDGVLLGEFIKAGSIQAEALSVEYKTSVTKEITAKFKVAEGLIEGKVSKGEFGSYMQQYYDRVLIGFNNDSKYVQITAGNLAIYDNGVSNSKKRAVFDQNGNHFYRSGYYVGRIGTNRMLISGNTYHGLEFDLEYDGGYMGWFAENAPGSGYKTVLSYTRNAEIYGAEGLHIGANMYFHKFWLSDVVLNNFSVGYGNVSYQPWTGSFQDKAGRTVSVMRGIITSVF